jgi:hypothetical protein
MKRFSIELDPGGSSDLYLAAGFRVLTGLKSDGNWVSIRSVWSSNSASQSLTGSPMVEDAPAWR